MTVKAKKMRLLALLASRISRSEYVVSPEYTIVLPERFEAIFTPNVGVFGE